MDNLPKRVWITPSIAIPTIDWMLKEVASTTHRVEITAILSQSSSLKSLPMACKPEKLRWNQLMSFVSHCDCMHPLKRGSREHNAS